MSFKMAASLTKTSVKIAKAMKQRGQDLLAAVIPPKEREFLTKVKGHMPFSTCLLELAEAVLEEDKKANDPCKEDWLTKKCEGCVRAIWQLVAPDNSLATW